MTLIDTESEKKMAEVFKIACMYLLYDRENETMLRTAFAALAQEIDNPPENHQVIGQRPGRYQKSRGH